VYCLDERTRKYQKNKNSEALKIELKKTSVELGEEDVRRY